jgi:hypothetical protein
MNDTYIVKKRFLLAERGVLVGNLCLGDVSGVIVFWKNGSFEPYQLKSEG